MRHFTAEHKKKLSDSHKKIGSPWLIGRKHSEVSKEKMRQKAKGRVISEEQREKLRVIRLGRKHSEETKRKMSSSRSGSRNWSWKGGITKESHRIRTSKEYRLWRESVLTRDGHKCIWCGAEGPGLHADHIKPFALFPELRFAIDNGRTLCAPCHRTTYKESYGKP